MNENTQQQTVIGGTQSPVASVALTRGFNSLSSHHLKQPQCHHDVTTIPLTRGQFALIDVADLPLVSGRKWQAVRSKYTYYASSGGILMHRLLLGLPPGTETDHKDGDGLNNTRTNIRAATRSINLQNRRKFASRSKYTGVKPSQSGKRWCARIYFNDKPILLGTHDTEAAAALAYNEAAVKFYGTFAKLNPIPLTPEQSKAA